MREYLSELENCELCEWRCGVNRLEGELGVCRTGVPLVASSGLHPATPESYTVFMSGCSHKCLGCQNWTISQYPDSQSSIRGFIGPKELAQEAINAINSSKGRSIGADRIFFSGGAPTPSLPYVERVVEEARKLDEGIKVNYDTNGFLTRESLERVLKFTTSITYDIKAYHDDVYRALTGAPVEPVLRNAEYIAENAKETLWEFRVLVIPQLNETEIRPIAEFLGRIDEELPLNFLAFRPNFALEDHPGASTELMEKAVETAKEAGLKNVSWSGRPDIPGTPLEGRAEEYEREGAKLAGNYAKRLGCTTHPRDCGSCPYQQRCPIKKYRAKRQT